MSMKSVVLPVSVLLTSWLALASFAAEVKQFPSQDGFDVALSSAERWVKTSNDKDFTGKIAPKLAVIRQVYIETLKVEKEVSVLMSASTKDKAWIDQALAVTDKITVLQERLPSSSTESEDVSVDKLVELDNGEMNKFLAELYWFPYDQYLFNRNLKSSIALFDKMHQVLKEEDLKMKKSAKL